MAVRGDAPPGGSPLETPFPTPSPTPRGRGGDGMLVVLSRDPQAAPCAPQERPWGAARPASPCRACSPASAGCAGRSAPLRRERGAEVAPRCTPRAADAPRAYTPCVAPRASPGAASASLARRAPSCATDVLPTPCAGCPPPRLTPSAGLRTLLGATNAPSGAPTPRGSPVRAPTLAGAQETRRQPRPCIVSRD